MESDPLKAAWNHPLIPGKASEEIPSIARRKNNPVLKSIRRQLAIEGFFYAVFLLAYYDLFDGNQRPFYLNILLILCIFLMLLHNISGYLALKDPVKGDNLKESLKIYRSKITQYSIVSIASRLLGIAGLLVFFLAGIKWTPHKYWVMATLAVLLAIQFIFLWRIWSKRINKISGIIEELSTP